MKTQALLILATVISITSLGCSSGSSSGDASVAAAATITVTPNPVTAAPNGTASIMPTGGTAPYTFSLISSIGGSVQSLSTYGVFTAGSIAGAAEIQVTDANNNTVLVPVTVTSTGTSGTVNNLLTVSPMGGSVAPSGQLTFTTSGGNGTYTYTVISPTIGGGSFSGNIYIAPATPQTVTIEVSDTAGNATETTITVTTSATSSNASCNATFTLNMGGYIGNIQFTTNTSGVMSGLISFNGEAGGISGTCLNGVVNFTDIISGDPFTGTFYVNPANTAQGMWYGTLQDEGTTYNWSAY